MTIGRPTKFREEYCDLVCDLAAEGKGPAEWAYEIGVDRVTLYRWAETHSTFATAIARAKDYEQAAWERLARENIKDRNFNAQVWSKSMSARFRNDYTERQEVEQTFHGLPSPTVHGIQFTVIDPAKLPTDDLEALADMMNRQQSPVIDHETPIPNPITESNSND